MARRYYRYVVACESGDHYTSDYLDAFRFYQGCTRRGEHATLWGVDSIGEFTVIFSCGED